MLAGVFEAIWEVFGQHSDPVWAGGAGGGAQFSLFNHCCYCIP